jgi:hypothetical protein
MPTDFPQREAHSSSLGSGMRTGSRACSKDACRIRHAVPVPRFIPGFDCSGRTPQSTRPRRPDSERSIGKIPKKSVIPESKATHALIPDDEKVSASSGDPQPGPMVEIPQLVPTGSVRRSSQSVYAGGIAADSPGPCEARNRGMTCRFGSVPRQACKDSGGCNPCRGR